MAIIVIYFFLIYQYIQVQGLATDVRLSHGQNSDGVEFKSYEGAIEVLVNDTWGPIMRHGVDSITAKTVCKILGHGLTGFVVEQFSFTGRPLLRSLSCVGNETSIAECTQDPLSGSFEKYDAPGVHCFPQVFNELRLVDGEGPNTGTVNIKMDGRWGLLCGYPTGNRFPTPTVDTVICRTLGYQRTIDPAPRFGQYGDIYNGWLDIDKITCSGSETNLNQCTVREGTLHRQPRCNTFRAVHCVTNLGEFCTSDDICVATKNAVCFDNICKCKPGYVKSTAYTCIGISQSIRLLPFTEQIDEGYLQALVDGSLTLFYDPLQNFTDTTAKMICQAMGFGFVGFGGRYFYTSSNGSNAAAEFGLFECKGDEFSLEECVDSKEFPQRTVSSGQLVNTIHCFDRWIKDVRLVGGDTSYAGQLEVKIGDRWGPVCLPTNEQSKAPSDATTSVICQSLRNAGRGGYLNTVFSSSGYNIPWINSIECENTHTDINQCNYTIGPQTDMDNNYCSSGGMDSLTWWSCPPIQLVYGPSEYEGRVEVGFYGQQYTLCSEQINKEIANVICRELNYSATATYYSIPELWNGTIDNFPQTIQCLGNETSLEQCQISNSSDAPCASDQAIYVHCSALLGEFCTSDNMCAAVENSVCLDNICQCRKGYIPDGIRSCISVTQSIMLLPFTLHDNEGFLLVRVNGSWTLVTGDDYTSFTDTTAKMICNALGFGLTGFSSWYHTNSPGPDYTAKYGLFECNGTETSLEECFDPDEYPQRTVPSVKGVVTSLHCFDLRIDDVRIVGQEPYLGAVDVKIGERWGRVCEIYKFNIIKSTSDITKEVICNSVRKGGHGGYNNTVYESTNYMPWLSLIECDDTYDDINQCRFITGSHIHADHANGCSAYSVRDMILTCPPIQLINGTSKNVGRIEVGFSGQQYTLCGDRMNMAVANVTCAVKGFSSVGNIFYNSDFGKGTADIFPHSIQCTGNETSLESCQISNTLDVQCPSGKVGGVECLIHIGDRCYNKPFACSSIPNAECAFIGMCYCKSGYTDVTTRHCDAIYEFRLIPAYADIYEGIVEVKVNGVWMVVPVVKAKFNETASILCKTLGISKIGYTADSNQAVYFEENVTVLDGLMHCYGHEHHATECDIPSGNTYEVSMLDAGWTKIRCSHCEKGFYGPHCTMCDCNGHPCNVSTGVCMCDSGWEGDTCSSDIDECSISPDICPEHYVCANTLGSFYCECSPGYKFNGSHCEACEGMYYGQECLQVCDCEEEHVIQATTNRSCDEITGHCSCLPEWTGSRCNQSASSGSTDVKMLIIIISSATVGFLLLVVVIVICVCKFRKSGTKGEDKPSINARRAQHTVNRSTINDRREEPAVKVETEYDLHRDFLDRPNRRTDAYTGGYDSAGYLKPRQINKKPEYDYPYADKRPDTDPFGYLQLDRGKRKLPELPSDGQSLPYEGLKGRRQTEHEYSKMRVQE